jgi:mRNA interferase MazF
MNNLSHPVRGEIWLVDLNPVRGHEQAGTRPCLIFSVDQFNQSAADVVVAIPLTSKFKGVPLHVEILPPEGGLKILSYIKCEDVRSLAKERLLKCLGKITENSLALVEDRIRILLGL